MKDSSSKIYWDDILEKFSFYKGSITGFCKKYTVNIHQLYYYRKKADQNKVILHPISLVNNLDNIQPEKSDNEAIIVEMGKLKISVPTDHLETLSSVIKVLLPLC